MRGGKRPGAGRPKGRPNKVTAESKAFFQAFLERNVERVQGLWESVAEDDPAKALSLLWDASERVIPKLGRTEVTGQDGQPIRIVRVDRVE